ncbi:heme exporter protein CcmD [Phreatobacter cathodiphilus]|uniref:Heme exporter protein D n=1 Tax=Phreatobacter cathodiphilus TaxID=1868589 RepID=A0A2S0NF16_9HYPH|nr:heme exporter protein CcmD [Phreatobacter cathodiphilus]AVO46657.1 heme exporter protein CcmD [Phreatobacter cathodiphilus]
MFGSDPHAGFILASYAVTAVTVVALAAWIVVDYRNQKARLSELEARGISRRSARGGSASS